MTAADKTAPRIRLTPEEHAAILKSRNELLEPPKKGMLNVMITDVHSPFHNVELTNKALQYISDVRPFRLILGGDFLDMFSISKYAEGSLAKLEGLTLKREYEEGRELLAKFEHAARYCAEKVFIFGNHEKRFDTWIERGDNKKLAGAIQSVREGLALDENHWKVIEDYPDGFLEIAPQFHVLHGIYTNIYTSRNHLDKMHGYSMMFGHTHRIQVHANDKHCSYNIGGFFDKNATGFKYMPRPQRGQWANGFGTVYVNDNGNYYPDLITCYGNSFVIGGKMY